MSINKKPVFYDVHTHIDLIEETQIEKVLKKSKKEKIKKIISCSTSYESNKKNMELSEKFNEIECAIGLYPLNLLELNQKELNKSFNFFEKKIPNAIAIGEIGLDYKYCTNETEKQKQKKVFERFIQLGKKYDKPLIIHSRYAQREVLEILEKNNAQKVLLHGFIESKKLIKRAISNNYNISIGMIILKDELAQKNVLEIPLNKLFLETDSPIRFNQEKVFPHEITKIASKISEITNISIDELSLIQKNNFEQFFCTKM